MQQIGVIGAGAVAEIGYLPALSGHPDASLHAIVDVDETRADRLATAYDAPVAATSTEAILDDVDGVIIATPPAYHAEIARQCIEHGVAVLTEKPVATTSEEARAVVDLARQRNVPFAISRQLRESPSCRLIRLFARSGALGPLEEFSMTFGDETEWAFASDYRVRKSLSWGGVLTDKAPHALDVLIWIFGEDVSAEHYEDDCLGGIEANATVSLSFDDADVTGTLRVTASRSLPNRLTVRGRDGMVGGNPKKGVVDFQQFHTGEKSRISSDDSERMTDYRVRIGSQVHRFIENLETGRESFVPAATGCVIVSLIEACYASRETTLGSWERDLLQSIEVE